MREKLQPSLLAFSGVLEDHAASSSAHRHHKIQLAETECTTQEKEVCREQPCCWQKSLPGTKKADRKHDAECPGKYNLC